MFRVDEAAHPGVPEPDRMIVSTRAKADLAPHEGAATRHLAMPLGGIGTGNVAVCGDGALRQWQLHNTGNHRGFVPDSFFAIRVTQSEPPANQIRLLQSAPLPPADPTPLVTDDVVPHGQRRLGELFGTMRATSFTSIYPFADIDFHDDVLPVAVHLEAFTPLVPLNVADSSRPVAMFAFTLTNISNLPAHVWLAGTVQNAVGWDGVTPIDGVDCPVYGGNVNRVERDPGWAHLVAENPSLSADHPGAGQMVLSVDDENASSLVQWNDPEQFLRFLQGRALRETLDASRFPRTTQIDPQPSGPAQAAGPSPAGRTWNGGLCASVALAPGQVATVRYLLAWHFPNRYVNFDQYGPRRDYGFSRFWLGNAYTRAQRDAVEAARAVQARWKELRDSSLAWVDTLLDSGLDAETAQRMAAQAVVMRSPTCFRAADGEFFGFEGVLGASTTMWSGDHGGSCPLNCTHVWNYEQALSRLFPELERSMREIEFEVTQAPEGYLPHRVIVPTYLPQLWGVGIGGPEEPALDGMLGAVLKTYREVRLGAGEAWLARYWRNIVALVDYVRRIWDPANTGVLRGNQPSTHDIDLRGVNSFMGTYWLAALRAAVRLAQLRGDEARAAEWTDLFQAGGRAYDELLFNGEYYIQLLEPDDDGRYQWGEGCLSDQLIGQWWAHQLDLGYLLPADHVRTALASVVRHNFRESFDRFRHDQRVYADGGDAGLLMCTWPRSGRPDTAVRYADEVWSGVEYQVAAHCFMEGMRVPGEAILTGLWRRHDGRRRNPFNEIECGDHYARSMAGWSVLEARTGVRHDATNGRLTVTPPVGTRPGRYPFVVAGGWGTLDTGTPGRLAIDLRAGRVWVAEIDTGHGPAVALEPPRWIDSDGPVEVVVGHPAVHRSVTVPTEIPRPASRRSGYGQHAT
jgi:uncharacterized protein (DUF608 family)